MTTLRCVSKAWSCGSLVVGASKVVDGMAAPAADVVSAQRQAMRDASDLSEEEILQLLEDMMKKYGIFLGNMPYFGWHEPCCLKIEVIVFFFQLNLKYALHMQETEAKINNHEHNKCDQVAAIDRWLFVKQEEHDNLLLAEA